MWYSVWLNLCVCVCVCVCLERMVGLKYYAKMFGWYLQAMGIILVSQAAVTKYHKLGGLKQQIYIVSQF